MRIRTVGAGCLVAFVLAGCADKKDSAGNAKPGGAVAERQASGGSPSAAPGGEQAQLAPGGEAGWIAQAGPFTVDRPELEAYALRQSPQGLEGLSREQKRDLALKLLVRKAVAVDAEREGFGADPAVARADMAWKFKAYPKLYWAETVEKEATVSDDELRALIQPQTQYLLSAIVLGDDEAAGREAERIHALLLAGGDFAKLASEFSLGFSASRGGDMDWTEIPSKMIEAPEGAIVAATPPGAITRPVLTRLGWTIFKVRERVDAEKIFHAEKAKRLPALRLAKIDAAQRQRMGELRARATITYPAVPGLGAPAAIVNGYAFPADPAQGAPEEHGNIQRDVTPEKQQLERTINAFLIVLDAERIGIDRREELRIGRAQQRMEVLAQLYLRSKGQAVVTPAEEREEYQRYYSPDVYEFQMILVDSREKAAAALGRARAGEEFGKLAKEFNTGKLAASAGHVPPGSTSKFAPAIQAALPALADGGVSGVLDADGGSWAVVKRLAKRVVAPPAFEQVAAQVRKRIELRKRAELTEAFLEGYRKNMKVVFNDKLLARL